MDYGDLEVCDRETVMYDLMIVCGAKTHSMGLIDRGSKFYAQIRTEIRNREAEYR